MEKLSDKDREIIDETLHNLVAPAALDNSPWLASCLVAKRLEETPEITRYEALWEVFSEVLSAMQSNEADLLHGRFWEDHTVDEMVELKRPRQMAPSTFYNTQKRAIHHFALLLWEREQLCKRELAAKLATNEAQEVESEVETTPPSSPSWRMLLGIVAAIALILLVAGFILLPRIAPQANLGPSPTALAANAMLAPSQPPSPVPPTTFPTTSSQPTLSTPTPNPPTATPGIVYLCKEATQVVAQGAVRFLRSQGVSAFTKENTEGGVLNNRVRAVALDQRGLWIGYFATEQDPTNGVGQFDGRAWRNCNQGEESQGRNVNAIAIDKKGRVWAGTEKSGIAMFDGTNWHTYSAQEGLPSDEIYGLTVDTNGAIWAATWEGVAKFEEELNRWEVKYTVQSNTIFNNHTHAIAFDSSSNIWVAHITHGVSEYNAKEGKWIHHRASPDGIGGDKIRSIAVRSGDAASPESVWFATADSGVSKFENGKWTVYRTQDGLPSDDVRTVALDKHNRVWAATSGGVAYFDGKKWIHYNSLDTASIAFGPKCEPCPYDEDAVWTATVSNGLTHSRVPYPDAAIDILKVCFAAENKESDCHTISQGVLSDTITVTYTQIVSPGETFRFEITASPRAPYSLREDRGDFLSTTDENNANLYGAFEHIAVKGTIDPGQPFTFTDFDNPFKAPQLAEGEQEKTFVSTWRIWTHTRYAGPYIRLVFIVRKP